uniref:30S ribosomal protein 3, chloroplastic n=1 Tax=Protohalopteris sp. TaxID=2843287 RepID=A0A8F0F7A3_9PHAE|nr:hypothetical protein [Protohalopteris sp.]
MSKFSNVTKNKYTFKIIWGRSYIGLAVDKRLNKDIMIPLTTFFFWPRENGWELLKMELSNKPWITKEDRIEILNGYTLIINYWLSNVQEVEGITKLVQDSSIYNFELLANF